MQQKSLRGCVGGVATIGPEKRSSGIGKPAEGAHRQDEFRRPSAGCAGVCGQACGGGQGRAEKSSRVQRVQEIELSPNGQVVALIIPAGHWHTVRALESGSVILEMKDGAYNPSARRIFLRYL